jgi:hypothetical protein
MLAAQELVRRIRAQEVSEKLSDFTTTFYSDTVWSCVRMSEAGIPFSIPKLQALESQLDGDLARCVSQAKSQFDLTLEGEGSHLSKMALIDRVIEAIDGVPTCQSTPTHSSASAETPTAIALGATTSGLPSQGSSSSSPSSSFSLSPSNIHSPILYKPPSLTSEFILTTSLLTSTTSLFHYPNNT